MLPISTVTATETEEELAEVLSQYPSDFWPRYNFDGMLCDFPVGRADLGYAAGYVQLFRTGVIEAADNYGFVEEEGKTAIDGYSLDEGLIKAGHRYFRLLRELGVAPPIYLMLSLVGVHSYQMLHDSVPYGYRSALRPVDRDVLVVPEVMVESLEQDRHGLQRLMRPLLDAVWNAVGLPRSPHYDENGNWQLHPA